MVAVGEQEFVARVVGLDVQSCIVLHMRQIHI